MFSSVLNSKRAIQVNIQIMRTFTKLREMLVSNKELREKIVTAFGGIPPTFNFQIAVAGKNWNANTISGLK